LWFIVFHFNSSNSGYILWWNFLNIVKMYAWWWPREGRNMKHCWLHTMKCIKGVCRRSFQNITCLQHTRGWFRSRFITAFTTARHLSLSWVTSIQSMVPLHYFVEPDKPQKTILQRMRFEFPITKATNTHSEHVILTPFPLQLWLSWRASMLRYTRWFKYDRGWFVCKQVTVCPGHIWTTLHVHCLSCLIMSQASWVAFNDEVKTSTILL
jgi:hypothetical protein